MLHALTPYKLEHSKQHYHLKLQIKTLIIWIEGLPSLARVSVFYCKSNICEALSPSLRGIAPLNIYRMVVKESEIENLVPPWLIQWSLCPFLKLDFCCADNVENLVDCDTAVVAYSCLSGLDWSLAESGRSALLAIEWPLFGANTAGAAQPFLTLD